MQKSGAPRVLVVEDEPNIRELVCLHLGLEGYACEGVGDGQEAFRRTEAERFDLLVLDVMLPGLDGVSLCRAVRRGAMNRDAPILMLTARTQESGEGGVRESGAGDSVRKPWGVRERVGGAGALRRGPRRAMIAAATDLDGDDGARPVHIHGIDIDLARRRVRIAGRDVEL